MFPVFRGKVLIERGFEEAHPWLSAIVPLTQSWSAPASAVDGLRKN
jgi:hypothetical protein